MRSAICKPEIEIPYYQRGLRINDRNSENVLFANVSYDVFNMDLRKRKQPDSDSG